MGFRRHRTCLEFIAIVMYREDPIGSYSINILVPVLPSLLVSKADLFIVTCAHMCLTGVGQELSKVLASRKPFCSYSQGAFLQLLSLFIIVP